METAQIVALRVAPPSPTVFRSASRTRPSSSISCRLSDRSLAAFVEQRAPDDRAELIERALRIGLHALQDAGTSIDVDFVRREFDALLERNVSANERAAHELDQVLRTNFADQDGRLPRTLERFLGDRGQLNKFVTDLFDETKRDSAIGRMRQLLGTYFDGDASRLAQLLDPTRLGSPLHQFRNEMAQGFEKLNERLTALEAAQIARSRGAFEVGGQGHRLRGPARERCSARRRAARATSSSAPDRLAATCIRSKKGDFLLTIDPQWCHGADLRVVIEAKNRPPVVARDPRRARRREAQPRRRHGARASSRRSMPRPASSRSTCATAMSSASSIPTMPDHAALGAAVRLARLYAVATLVEHEDADRCRTRPGHRARHQDRARSAARPQDAADLHQHDGGRDVNAGLDRLRDAILARVADAETQLRAGTASATRLVRCA